MKIIFLDVTLKFWHIPLLHSFLSQMNPFHIGHSTFLTSSSIFSSSLCVDLQTDHWPWIFPIKMLCSLSSLMPAICPT
jgi:hypothetical protein